MDFIKKLLNIKGGTKSMEECLVCSKSTDNEIMWIKENESRCTPQYVCESCMWKSINKEKAEYQKQYDIALKYLKDNNYKVIVTGYDDYKEKFEINRDAMECVSIIRKRMEQQGYCERWIDVAWETYENCEIEVVTYLYFVKYSKTEVDEYGDFTIEYGRAFWIELTNEALKCDF